jgi:hypothetical protein
VLDCCGATSACYIRLDGGSGYERGDKAEPTATLLSTDTRKGLKDQNRAQPLQSATLSYRKISYVKYSRLLSSGPVVCGYPHKSRTVASAEGTP